MVDIVLTHLPTAGDDTLVGTEGPNVLAGYNGNDSLVGGNFDDLFFEGVLTWTGDDAGPFVNSGVYNTGLGNDTFVGGAGFDMLIYDGTNRAVRLDIAGGLAERFGEIDRFSGIEAFVLTGQADVVTGVTGGVTVSTGDGNDRVTGIAAGAFVDAGVGFDRLDLTGVVGDVEIHLGGSASHVGGGDFTAAGFEQVDGPLGHRLLVSGTDAWEWASGGRRGDRFEMGAGGDRAFGGAGDDLFIDGQGSDTYDGGAGRDTLDLSADGLGVTLGDGTVRHASGGIDVVSGIEVFVLGGGDDLVLNAGPGVTVRLGGGRDGASHISNGTRLYGGAGRDLLDLSGMQADLRVDLTAGEITWLGASALASGFDDFTGTTGAASRVIGTTDANRIEGGDLGDTLLGGGGADAIRGNGGDDVIRAQGATIFGGDGQDTIVMAPGGEFDPHGRVNGGDGNDVVRISAVRNVVDLGAGDDEFSGGWDLLDSLRGLVRGGDGFDTLVITRSTPFVSIFDNAPARHDEDAAEGFEAFVFEARSVTFAMFMSDLELSLGAGRDGCSLVGDRLTLDTGAGVDWVNISGADAQVATGLGADRVRIENGSQGARVDTGSGNDSLEIWDGLSFATTGAGSDSVFVNDRRATGDLDLGAGDDFLYGVGTRYADLGAGNDYVRGMARTSVVRLGSGADQVHALAGGGGIVEDFDPAEDRILVLRGTSPVKSSQEKDGVLWLTLSNDATVGLQGLSADEINRDWFDFVL